MSAAIENAQHDLVAMKLQILNQAITTAIADLDSGKAFDLNQINSKLDEALDCGSKITEVLSDLDTYTAPEPRATSPITEMLISQIEEMGDADPVILRGKLSLVDEQRDSVAHEMARRGYRFEDPKILGLTNNIGWSVADTMQAYALNVKNYKGDVTVRVVPGHVFADSDSKES